jgi:chemotaxis protein CheY-P-specific phosphatase CheC
MNGARKAEVERIAELADVGAARAAEAFAQLVDRPIRANDAIVFEGQASIEPDDSADADSAWSTGVFFEFEGCLDALVGILFPGAASEALVRRIVGIESGELEPAVIESALMEVGNILASHVASGIADAVGSRLLPSIPSLAMDGAEKAFQDLIESVVGGTGEQDPLRIESALLDEGGALRGRLVLVPTRLGDESGS